MANYILKKGDSYVEVPTDDATAIAAWIALGYSNMGTSIETVAPDSKTASDLIITGKVIFGGLEEEGSIELSKSNGALLIKGFTGGNYVTEYTLVNTGVNKVLSGDTGIAGPIGATGILGPAGATGAVLQGATGLMGVTGLAGAIGATGSQGVTGVAA